MFTHNRNSISLNGTWKFNPDPYTRCKQQSWWKGEGPDSNIFPCFNLEGLWDIQVPGTWKTQFEQVKWYDGDANYVKEFELPEIPADHEAFLCFDGVVYSCNVYLNGEHVGDHDWGYSPFQLRVTDHLKRQNRLFVLVNNTVRADRVPGIRCDWNNDGGIINGVKLVFVPKIHIGNFRTSTKLDGRDAVIGVQCTVSGIPQTPGATVPVTFEIPEIGVLVRLDVPVGGAASAEARVPLARLQLWSPENPRLYPTRLTTPYEVLNDEIGYREIRTEGHSILLNGKAIRLYGVAVHSEFPGTGRTATPEGIEAMVAKARELGCNFLRCAHYPYADIFARAMDKAGMLWWEEVPVYWLAKVHEEPQRSMALGMLGEMIVRDWNRASLIIWSVSNECAGAGAGAGAAPGPSQDLTEANYPYWVEACALVRKLDPSRLISSADSGFCRTVKSKWTPDKGDEFDENHEVEELRLGHPDSFYGLLDVLGANKYVRVPGANPAAIDKLVALLRKFNKPLMITEFGSMSTTDWNPPKPETITGHPKYHETILREGFQVCHAHPEIVGTVPWCLMDVRVPMHWRWYNRGSGTFAYGLLDNDYRPKRIWEVAKEEVASLRKRFGDL